LSDLIRHLILVIGNEIGQSHVRCRTISAHIMREREFETAIALVWCQLSFTQSRLAVATLDCNHRLPSMSASSGRMQLCRFARNRIRFIEFSLKEKITSQSVLRWEGKRVDFHCLPSLFLGLVEFTKVNDGSSQQVIGRGIARGQFCRTL